MNAADKAALAEKLAALLRPEAYDDRGARILSRDGTPHPVSAILREVDHTMLERCLSFDCGDSRINVIAAGRRFRGILNITPGHDNACIGQVLSREDPATVRSVRDLLHAVCENSRELTVRSLPAVSFGKAGERGISARGLAELWKVSLDHVTLPAKSPAAPATPPSDPSPPPQTAGQPAPEPQPPQPMAQFLAANETAFVGMLHIGGRKLLGQSGNVDGLKTILANEVAPFRKAYEQVTGQKENAQLICLDGAFGNAASAALAFHGDEVALMAFKPRQFGKIQASWQRIFT